MKKIRMKMKKAEKRTGNGSMPDDFRRYPECSQTSCLIVIDHEKMNAAPDSHDHSSLIEAGLDFILSPHSPKHWHLEKTEKGKPFLADHPDIHISISDSGGYVVCAFAPVPVGIDLQEIRSLHRTPLQLADRFFTKDEYEMLQGEHDGQARADLFCRLWTIKESCLKCTGHGLGGGLNLFQPDFSTGQVVPPSGHTAEFSFPSLFFTELKAPENYHLTIASPTRILNNNIHQLSLLHAV